MEESEKAQKGEEGVLSSWQILAQTPSLDFFVAPIAPPRAQVAVPFKWEEAPGKPKPSSSSSSHLSTSSPLPSLQLPPCLLHSHSSDVRSCNSPSLQRSQSSKQWRSSIKHMWKRVGLGKKEEDSWSPTSILFGPSSSSMSSEAMAGEESDVAAEEDGRSSKAVSSYGGRRRRLARIWQQMMSMRKWKAEQRRRFGEEGEMWAPTLATYFHSMELERESVLGANPPSSPSSFSAPLPLVPHFIDASHIDFTIASSLKKGRASSVGTAMDGAHSTTPSSSSSRGWNRRDGRKWVEKKLKKSSGIVVDGVVSILFVVRRSASLKNIRI